MTTDIAVRGHYEGGQTQDFNEEYDENSSARLFERSRIKALAGELMIEKNINQIGIGRNKF